ncbi:hypothetical protein Rs2_51002 [Raphanus sativus]|nr:hypothetical protein Rs2_51002 [Raphanus sativus]
MRVQGVRVTRWYGYQRVTSTIRYHNQEVSLTKGHEIPKGASSRSNGYTECSSVGPYGSVPNLKSRTYAQLSNRSSESQDLAVDDQSGLSLGLTQWYGSRPVLDQVRESVGPLRWTSRLTVEPRFCPDSRTGLWDDTDWSCSDNLSGLSIYSKSWGGWLIDL